TLYTSAPVFVDLDADGDLDLMAGELEGGFKYYTNIGTVSAPVFGVPQFNPFSLTDIGFKSTPTFADLDNDGDMDMLAGEYNAHFYYFRNTGTAQNPSFASVQIDPFTFTKIACMSAPAFADLDNDGDSDVLAGQMYGNFYFFENICVHPVAPDTIFETRATCPNEHFIFSTEETNGATSYIWTLPPGWTGSSSSDSIQAICGSDPGIISVSATNSCGTSSPITYSVHPAIDSIQPASPVLTDLSGTCSVTPAIPATSDNCAGTITGTTSTIFPITEIGSHTITWTFDDGNGNFTIVSQNITITAPSIDVSTTVNGLTISANNTSAGISYQWIDCSTGLPINQEIQQSFTASANGSYAVILTDGLCSDTSDCVTINAINIYEKQNGITTLNVYPNPSTAIFTIENAKNITKLSLTDVSGKLILEKEGDCKYVDLSGFETGMYILTATMENGSTSNTIIIRQK
ncbi:MAG TPA: FG-GAP-like repeat-containing protein, partial [Bacteroidia bacterium]